MLLKPSPGSHATIFAENVTDIERTVGELERKGVEFVSPIMDEGFGLMTRLRIPGAGEIGIYEPRHASPLAEFADSGS